jgi:dTDP-D-glucose 4,6-dehydratase
MNNAFPKNIQENSTRFTVAIIHRNGFRRLKNTLDSAINSLGESDETFKTGIRKTVQWYLDNKVWSKHVKNGRY